MEDSTRHDAAEQTTLDGTDKQGGDLPSVTLFTSFGLGRSYIFHFEKAEGGGAEEKTDGPPALECWGKLFEGREGWDFKRLKNYNKPLGETATLTFSAATGGETAAAIEELRHACEAELEIDLELTEIETIFFTTGVAVLVMRLRARASQEPRDILKYTLKNEDQLKEVRDPIKKIIELSKAQYLEVMNAAEKRGGGSCSKNSKWFLSRFKEVDREDWEPKQKFSYPVFFVGSHLYEQRTEEILRKVAGSTWQHNQQSDDARISYEGSEIYVDWSEALVRKTGKNRALIENNFIIALASWYALVLMNKNSSMFLFQAYIGTVTAMPQSKGSLQETAITVNQRNMAYKDVADASLPIRWTTQRRDLFLLETIHRNWSSDRWRNNIDERMKLLVMHYRNLEDKLQRMEEDRRYQEDERRRGEDDERRKEKDREDERRREEKDRREKVTATLGYTALFLTVFTLTSASADVIGLLDKTEGNPTLRTVGLIASLAIPILVGTLLYIVFRGKFRWPSEQEGGEKKDS